MSGLRTIAAVAACRITRAALRVLHRGGTALPGKAALLFDPKLLRTVSDGMEIIVVTGTNGKTTTCSMLEHVLESGGYTCLSNKSGANLLSGVTAELACSADWTGRAKTRYAVIECDEGALKQVTPLIRPKVIAVTNLFRDQLDRYGEVMHTLEEIRKGVLASPGSILCLNADDPLVSSLAQDVPNPVLYYGMDVPAGSQEDPVLSDAKYCIRCGAEYRYSYHTYAHLGGFSCPQCGYQRQEPDCAVMQILEMTPEGSSCRIRLPEKDAGKTGSGRGKKEDAKAGSRAGRGREYGLQVGLPAVYNLYNALAAACAGTAFGLRPEQVLEALKTVHSSFGRMEHFTLGKTGLQMILVKNPAGCDQAISYLISAGRPYRLLLCLNDRTADGHDISWIWDADYERLAADRNLTEILTAGDRAEDLLLRLKYAGVSPGRMQLVREPKDAVGWIAASEVPVFALPNYTSMLELREAVRERTGAQEFWK